MNINTKKLAYAGMIFATIIWGLNFVVIKMAIGHYPVLPFLFLRFLIGGTGLLVLALLHPKIKYIFKKIPKFKIIILSGIVAIGYVTSAMGIKYGIAPATASIISAMVLVITPLLDWVITKKRPNFKFIFALLLSSLAVILVASNSVDDAHSMSELGLILEFISVIAFSVQILILERLSQTVDFIALAAGQLMALALIFGVATIVASAWVAPSFELWGLFLFSGLGASGIGFMLQALAQKHMEGATIAIITSFEPGYAMFFSFIFLGSAMGLSYILAILLLAFAAVIDTPVGTIVMKTIWIGMKEFATMSDVYREIYARQRGSILQEE